MVESHTIYSRVGALEEGQRHTGTIFSIVLQWIGALDSKIDLPGSRMDSRFRWVIGVVITTLMTFVAPVAGIPGCPSGADPGACARPALPCECHAHRAA